MLRDLRECGMVVLCDPRLRARSDGRVFLGALPPMPLVEDAEEALAFAAGLLPQFESQDVASVP